MRNHVVTSAVVCAGLLVAVEAAPRAPEQSRPATVGEFAVRIAMALGHDDAAPEAAARYLRARGADLGADLGIPLTEGVAAGAMADLGFAVVTPADPSAPVSEARATYLAGAISAGAVSSTDLPGGIASEGIGPSASLAPILVCLQSPSSALCTQCCLALLPPRFPSGIGTQICTRLCALSRPPSSPP
jgi:hypothetical protein